MRDLVMGWAAPAPGSCSLPIDDASHGVAASAFMGRQWYRQQQDGGRLAVPVLGKPTKSLQGRWVWNPWMNSCYFLEIHWVVVTSWRAESLPYAGFSCAPLSSLHGFEYLGCWIHCRDLAQNPRPGAQKKGFWMLLVEFCFCSLVHRREGGEGGH